MVTGRPGGAAGPGGRGPRRPRGGARRGRARRCCRRRARRSVDLEGGALLPSFGDGHVHPLWGGVELAGPPVREATSVAEVVEAVRRWAGAHPDVDWVQGGPYDPTPRPRRPVRRGLARRRRPGPAGRAPVDRPPLRLGEHRGAAPGRHRRAHPGPAGRRGRAAAGRHARWGRSSSGPRWTSCCATPRGPPSAEQADGLAARRRLLAAAGITWVQEAALAPGRRRRSTSTPRPPAGSPSASNIALRAEPGPVAGPAGRVRRGPRARPPSRRSPVRCRRAP